MNNLYYERGKMLIESNILQIDNLRPVSFQLPIDWNNNFNLGDTFLYCMQCFKILRYVCGYHETSQNILALQVGRILIEDWLMEFGGTVPQFMKNTFGAIQASNSFVWHDHTTALRAENWLNFMHYCKEHAPDFWADSPELHATIKQMLVRHGNILAKEEFYSAHCNHGIEQARVLLLLAEEPSLASLPESDQKVWRSIAIDRLTEEYNTCFTSEGVHKENSPGHHVFVFKTLLNILADPCLQAVHSILESRFELTARKALEFIYQILQPNLRLPIIGDTEHLPVTDSFHAALGKTEVYAHFLYIHSSGRMGVVPSQVNKVYPESGYAVFRNKWTYPDMFHLVCKAGCLSHNHYQADEGQFILFARGEHWFIDGGFFDYNSSSVLFKYIRSRKAHNVPVVIGAALKSFEEREQSWSVDSWSETPGNAYINLTNTIYENVILKRQIRYQGAYEFCLTDEAECTDKQARTVQIYFHIPKDKSINIEGNTIRIESSQNICRLRIETTAEFTAWIAKGKIANGTIRSLVSWQKKQCEDSYVLTVSFKDIVLLKTYFYISIESKILGGVTNRNNAKKNPEENTDNALFSCIEVSTGQNLTESSSYVREIVFNSRRITWYLKKSQTINAPILVVLHGHGCNGTPAKFTSPNWNVVCPMDSFGWENKGSWFLGEKNDFFWIKAMGSILEQVYTECGTGRLYFWGSSMGGYGSLLHGYLHNAYAVYANVPQTHLYGTSYGSQFHTRFDHIFDGKESIYNNLANVMTRRHRTLYFMSFSGLEGCNYIEEQCLPLIKHFITLGQRYYLEMFPTKKHQIHHTIAQSLDILNNVMSKYE